LDCFDSWRNKLKTPVCFRYQPTLTWLNFPNCMLILKQRSCKWEWLDSKTIFFFLIDYFLWFKKQCIRIFYLNVQFIVGNCILLPHRVQSESHLSIFLEFTINTLKNKLKLLLLLFNEANNFTSLSYKSLQICHGIDFCYGCSDVFEMIFFIFLWEYL